MLCTASSKTVSFYKPVAAPLRRPLRTRQINHTLKPVRTYAADVNLPTEEIPAEAVVADQQQETSSASNTKDQQRSINATFKDSEDAAAWLTTLQEELHRMDEINVSVAAKKLHDLMFDFQKNPPENLSEGKENLRTSFNEIVPIIEQFGKEFDARGFVSCAKCLNSAYNLFQGDLENFETILSNLFKNAVNIKERFQEQHKEHFDELFGKLLEEKIDSKQFNRYRAEEMTQLLANLDYQDVDFCTRFIDAQCEMNFNQKNVVYVRRFSEANTKLRIYSQSILNSIIQYMRTGVRMNVLTLEVFIKLAATLAQTEEEKSELVSGFLQVMADQEDDFFVDNYVQMFYYLAALKIQQEQIYYVKDLLLKKIEDNFDQITPIQGAYIRQAQLFCQSQGVQVDLPEELEQICKNALKESTQSQIEELQNNEFVVDVYNKIKDKFPSVECGAAVSDGELLVSVLLQNGDEKFAIEPLSNKFYIKNVDQCVTGIKQAELDVLSSLGYKVVPVSQLKWSDDAVYQEEIISSLQ